MWLYDMAWSNLSHTSVCQKFPSASGGDVLCALFDYPIVCQELPNFLSMQQQDKTEIQWE